MVQYLEVCKKKVQWGIMRSQALLPLPSELAQETAGRIVLASREMHFISGPRNSYSSGTWKKLKTGIQLKHQISQINTSFSERIMLILFTLQPWKFIQPRIKQRQLPVTSLAVACCLSAGKMCAFFHRVIALSTDLVVL